MSDLALEEEKAGMKGIGKEIFWRGVDANRRVLQDPVNGRVYLSAEGHVGRRAAPKYVPPNPRDFSYDDIWALIDKHPETSHEFDKEIKGVDDTQTLKDMLREKGGEIQRNESRETLQDFRHGGGGRRRRSRRLDGVHPGQDHEGVHGARVHQPALRPPASLQRLEREDPPVVHAPGDGQEAQMRTALDSAV
eukprot:jgi/Mesvir1/21928/Mv04925-RA.1